MKLHHIIKGLLIALLLTVILATMCGCVSENEAIDAMENYLNETYAGPFKIVYIYREVSDGLFAITSWHGVATQVNSYSFFDIHCNSDGEITFDGYLEVQE